MDMKDYTLTCGEVIDNLLALADAYEKASAGKAPNGFAFNPTDAAANMKAAVHFIGSFGQQLPRWISVEERLPEELAAVLVWTPDLPHAEHGIDIGSYMTSHWGVSWMVSDGRTAFPTHWMPLPSPPEATP
jgi:hypothetical protein